MALGNVSSSDSRFNFGTGDDWFSDKDDKLHPHILGIIMTYCDFESLKNCRLVSQKWNIEALHILSKKIRIKIYGQTYSDQSKNYELQDKVNRLINCLENSKNPEKIFVHLFVHLLDSSGWREYTWPRYFVLLKKFGKYLQTFETANLMDCPLKNGNLKLHKLLTDWAVNLTSISIEIIPNPKNKTNEQANFGNIEFTQPLKLESIQLKCGWNKFYEFPLHFSTNCQIWLSSILNSSPNLKRMNIAPARSASTIIYKLISPSSNIFENLTEFEFQMVEKNEVYYNDIERILSAMKKLKKLTISSSRVSCYTAFCPSRRCFEGIKNSLRHLAFTDVYISKFYKQHGLNCIEWFPNLEFFEIRMYDDAEWDEDSFVYAFQGLVVSHKNLKKLLMLKVRNEIINVESIRAIVKSFPNLEVLHLDVDPYGEDMLRVDEIILEVAQLFKLKELEVMTIMDNKMQFTRGMQSIEHQLSLRNLTIGLYNKSDRFGYLRRELKDNLWDLSFTMDELKEPLLFAQSLQKLRLIGFHTEDENAVADFVREYGIPLKMEKLKEDF